MLTMDKQGYPKCRHRGKWTKYGPLCCHGDIRPVQYWRCEVLCYQGMCPMLEKWMKQLEYRNRNR